VEVTERDLCDAPGDLLRVSATLHELGWEVALDDVGANDAGVALLPVLRPDVVKLDMGLLAPRLTSGPAAVLRAVEAYVAATGASSSRRASRPEAHLARALRSAPTGGRAGCSAARAVRPAVARGPVTKPPRVEARPGSTPRAADPYRRLARARTGGQGGSELLCQRAGSSWSGECEGTLARGRAGVP
jgi:hypothetical protein